MEQFAGWWEILQPAFVLIGVAWLTYWDALNQGYVSDDIDQGGGIAIFDGKLHSKIPFMGLRGSGHGGAAGWCNDCQEGKCQKLAPFSVGILFKQLRWNYGKVVNRGYNKLLDPRNPNAPRDMRQWIAHSVLHHRFNIIVFSGVVVALYTFLSAIIGERLAFLTTLLFTVHPLGCQTVVWVSGIGYVISFFLCLIGLNFALLFPEGSLLALGIYAIIQLLSVEVVFVTCGVSILLAFLGMWPYAVISGLIALYTCFKTFKDSVSLRIKTFKEQQMGYSATFHPRKPIVMCKTIAYYAYLMFFPKRMGLYHKFGYHYEMPQIETEDWVFWAGVGVVLICLTALILAPFPVKLAIAFTTSFLILFMNWIVVHQFVSERYAWIPAIGPCLIVAFLLQNHLWLLWILFGVALMRTWAHIPTYKNELAFYESNIWNFPESEVAMGNAGVVALKSGYPGTAIDYWMRGTNTNPEYDVNWYNIYSITRGNVAQQYQMLCNPLNVREFLRRAVESKTCHFPKVWQEELANLDKELQYLQKFGQIQAFYNSIRNDPSKKPISDDLGQAIDNINNINNLLQAEKARQDANLVKELEEINRSVVQLDAKKKTVEEEKKRLEAMVEVKKVQEQQRMAIDSVFDKLSKVQGAPIVQQGVAIQPPPQQVQSAGPKVISIGASPNPVINNPVQGQGGQATGGTPQGN